MSGFLSDVGKAVSEGVDAAAEAVSEGVNAATEAVSDAVNAAAEAVSEGVDAAGRAVSRGVDAVNNACKKANDSMEAIRETVVSSPDILADMIADSMVGQCWSDFWDLNVDSVNAIEGMLEDTAEELANDEDVPGFIRDYMNGFIGADASCNFFGVVGAGCRGVEEMLSGVHKGVSSVLGHPCQTEENIADALIIAGEAAKYFIEDPQKATKDAISSVSGWWNDKNTYEKIRTVVEAYIMYRMIASSRSKGKTVTLESEEATGVAGETAETIGGAEKVGKAGAGGKGKVKIESADLTILDVVDSSALKHSSVGDFTYNPKTGAISKMKGGGHGQANLDFLDKHGIEYNIVKEYSNGVRVGNVSGHKIKAKRTGTNQSWFPRNWSEADIASAGEYVGNLPANRNVPDGVTVYGEYKGVRVGVIHTNGKISTIFPDASSQP